MARKSDGIPSYCLHKASGRAVVRIAGRDHYLGEYGSPESRRAYGELIARLGAGGDGRCQAPVIPLTVAGLAAEYDAFARTYYVKGGKLTGQYERVRRSMGVVLALFGSAPAADFGPVALDTCRNEMIRRGWSRLHVNSCVGCVRRAWRWAAARQLVPAQTFAALLTLDGLRRGRTQARETEPVGPVADDVVERTLAAMRLDVADMVRLQRLTGMRAGELCGLRAGAVDRTADVWVYRPADHKTAHRGRGRVVLIGPKAQAILGPHLEAAGPEGHVFSPARSLELLNARRRAERRTPMTPSQACGRRKANPKRAPGLCWTPNSYQKAIRTACRVAGVPVWTSHQLRHSAATEVRKLFGLEAAQQVLGHARADVTQVYAERDLAAAVAVARKIG